MKKICAMPLLSVFCCRKMVGGGLRLQLVVKEVVSASARSSQQIWCFGFSTTKNLAERSMLRLNEFCTTIL
jgi:hypothetical protein